MTTRRRFAIAALLALYLSYPNIASGHGDLASEYLVAHDVFLAGEADVGRATIERLTAAVRGARKAGLPVKVVVIVRPADLGLLARLYGKPQSYAAFLREDLSAFYRGAIVVVMPNGFGYAAGRRSNRPTLRNTALPKPGRNPAAEAEAATALVRRLASAAGHELVLPTRRESQTRDRITIAAATTAAIALAAAFVLYRRGRQPPRT